MRSLLKGAFRTGLLSLTVHTSRQSSSRYKEVVFKLLDALHYSSR